VSFLYLLIGALLLVLLVGVQLQMRAMMKKLDELTDAKSKE
jgi:hypothetical protein